MDGASVLEPIWPCSMLIFSMALTSSLYIGLGDNLGSLSRLIFLGYRICWAYTRNTVYFQWTDFAD